MKRVLICGVSGQDGAYLSKFLLAKNYEVFGGSRDSDGNSFINHKKLGILGKVKFISINICDFRSTLQTLIKIQPDEIYNLSGQSSVGLSFEQPVETFESISIGTLNLLEAIRFSGMPIKLYSAGSSECFGESNGIPANEDTPFKPRSPYAIAKATAYWQVANYREAYNLFACTGILFNHESPLRASRFVTKKIITTACEISRGKDIKLNLGNIDIKRDWGWAPDYVEAMWMMLQIQQPEDFVIATGITNTLRDFIKLTFEELGLNWEDYVIYDSSLLRPTDLMIGSANPQKAKSILKWESKHGIGEIIREMIIDQLNNIEN